MSLPTEPTGPQTDFSRLTVGLYGPPKIGKSSFVVQIPGVVIVDTEGGLSHLTSYSTRAKTWVEFYDACAELRRGDHGFACIAIDTVDQLYQMCMQHVCKRAGMEHPADLEYGRGWGLVNREFQKAIMGLQLLPYGLVWVSHARETQIDSRTGPQVKMVPSLTGGARQIVLNASDIILYCTQDGDGGRIMRTKPSPYYEAGDRTGALPDPLPLAWEALSDSWAEYAASIGGERDD